MGRTRSIASDSTYEKNRARYLKNRTHLLALAKKNYAEDRPARLAAMKLARDAAKEARLWAKSKAFYDAHPTLARDEYGLAREYVRNFKAGKPCLDCGKEYPHYVMEFDHVHGVKLSDISNLTTISKLRIEIPKCELVCANCHRERTFKRRRD